MENVQPWDRQVAEPEDAWVAFVRYRDGGVTDLRAFSATTGYPETQLVRWRSRWGWAERLLGWSRAVDEVRQGATLTAVQEMAERHIALAKEGLEICALALQKIKADLSTDFGRMKPQELARVLDVCTKLERLSRGEATERVEGADYGKLSDADLQALEEIARKL